ncbi:hypothetical protein [Phytomonospora endophytica]|uniref:Uncharacterized protein n=1 Tax=Phytomonospora endophytica TaxID=714109 RepID=A0A841G0R1_9ACTN|nr:hypothetical protein [Phytomonospora endophytica]MBB6038269.1 hypothetical protein [Phytomonospora endophytica]GIG64198.1 hypothetical protein Pen01_04930 [Phytomonospora endophytica]
MTRNLPVVTAVGALAYGALRAAWAWLGAPELPPMGGDLIVFTGWAPTSLCLAAAGIAIGLRLSGRSRALIVAGFGVAAALLVADALFLLDIVGVLTFGVDTGPEAAALASRTGCAAVALLLLASVVRYRRGMRGTCPRCGRRESSPPMTTVPGWARAGAWTAVAGCLVRVGAQIAVGFDGMPLNGSLVVFEGGFLLAGTLLPLALVHRWGRVWPRWTLFLAGRRVPRRLVLGPAVVFATGLVVYFGIALSQMAVSTATGDFDGGTLPAAFYWVAVPAYWAWGLGMGAASVAYFQLTRPACAACGRGESRLGAWSPSHTSDHPEPSARRPSGV